MPESYLWLVNHLGGVFTLGTFHRKFRQLENTWDDVVNIKRLSASHWCAWAIGHDHRVYIYVRSSDVPIRVPETTYENQRWSPVHGFSNKSLIMSDRAAWSNEAGTVYRPKESVRLPSAHWEWEGDWLIDDNLRGEIVGIEGWQYAFDFPAVYTPEKHWNSFVRKRKWIRFRRFSSTDVWARISDMEVVERTECFIDVSVGGFLMPSQPAGFLSVWAITNNGHVYVRTDVNHDNPEGSTWQELETKDQLGIINISVGASNLVWAVTWDGNMLVRSHVTRNNIYGTGWIVVEHPDNSTRFMQVSVGKNSVWAVSREGKVWFRKGTSGYDMFWNQESAIGTNWVEMVGEMTQVAVSSNDQVFAVDISGKNIYFRTGVTPVDLTGKTWQAVSLHEDLAYLEKEGLLSEGEICSCGDPDVTCAMHGETRPRLSSTTTSSSSISTLTNVDESFEGFTSPVLPFQPFPMHISETFSVFDSASSSWKQSDCMTQDNNNIDVFHHQLQTKTMSTSLTDVNSSSCPILSSEADCNSKLHVDDEKSTTAPLQKSCSFHTLAPSTSQLPPLSQVSSVEQVTFYKHPATAVVSSTTMDASHKMVECIHDSVLPADKCVDSVQKAPNTGITFVHTNAKENHSADKDQHITNSQRVMKKAYPDRVTNITDPHSVTNITDPHSVTNITDPHSVMQITNPIKHYCKSNEKIDSQRYVTSQTDSQDSIEYRKEKETSQTLFSEVVVDRVNLVNPESDRTSTHVIKLDHKVQDSSSALGKPYHFSNSLFPTAASHDSFRDSELISEQSKRTFVALVNDDDVFIGENSLSISQSKGDIIENVDEPVIKVKLAKEASRSSFKENDSLNGTPEISACDIDSSLGLTSFQEDNKGQVMQKKKSKERRPKIVDLSYNNPSDDSIIFKTFRTKKKRRMKLTSTTNDDVEKTDTISVSSDTSYGMADATEMHLINGGASLSPESPQKETDVDFIDGSMYDPYAKYESCPESSSYSPSADLQSPFSSLSHFSGDYLAAVGFNTDSAFTMLADFETARTEQNFSKTLKNNIPEATGGERDKNRLKPLAAAGGFDSTKPVVEGSDRDSAKSFNDIISPQPFVALSDIDCQKPLVTGSDRNSPIHVVTELNRDGLKTVVTVLDNGPATDVRVLDRDGPKIVVNGRNGSKPVYAACDVDTPRRASKPPSINISGEEGETGAQNFSTCDKLCDSLSKHTVSQDKCNTDMYCDINIKMLPNHIDRENIPDEHCCVHLSSCTYDTPEYIPANRNERITKVQSPPVETEAEDKMESHSYGDNTLENCISDVIPVSSVVEKTQLSRQNNVESQQLLKIEEFAHNHSASLDSTSNSDEIIDFVTVSDDESLDKKSQPKEDETESGLQCSALEDTNGVISPLQMIPESTIFHSQVSMINSKSRANSLSIITRDLNEDCELNESATPVQVMTSPNHYSSHTTSMANHPKSLPFVSIAPAKKVSKYFKSPSPSIVPTGDTIPLIPMTLAQPRLCWKWLDATSCVLDDPSTVEWLSNTYKESETKKKIVKIAKQLREDVLKKLQDRNKKEVHKFRDIEQAVKRTTWVKKASMYMYLFGRKNRWIECKVELEQGISNLSEGSLTVLYQHKGKQKNNQIPLSAMTCVKTCSDPDTLSGFVVYTPDTNIIHQPLLLRASSENEAIEWISCLSAANASSWNTNSSIAPGAIWSCTFTGDVFVSPATSAPKHLSELCWGQHGGHMRLVETGPSGVTWALGFDKMPYVYNNGYGGAIHDGTNEMSNNTQQIVDHHRVFVYENQKWFPVIGWCCKGIFHNDFHWLTESGRSIESKEGVKLPSSKCQWTSDWTVDFNTPGGVDSDGWQYSSNLYGPFNQQKHLRSSYRRRRWFRQYRITVFGPWQTAGSLGLVDVSVQVDPVASTFDPVIVWAVGANGDVLCPHGVTANNPKGQSWIHVATDLDKPFKSIAVGGSYRVWGIAADGSAWFRPGVKPYNQAGTCWLQVVPPPPGNFLLHQVSVGATSVWAVDTGDNLWRRENITPTFPEGTGWESVASRVKRVSVGPRDQVWIIADASFCKFKHGAGVIYSRVGITDARPSGTDWELVIGSGWFHVSVRGVSEAKQDDSIEKDST